METNYDEFTSMLRCTLYILIVIAIVIYCDNHSLFDLGEILKLTLP